ncbi:hypothetical protein [Runella salmonicolor]|uniref:Uncharacterized protein n=1 Tax=Runella salmonicolor TaxID=2950278 RepID=A0ABT1FST2_9BACT|nr:hypothetical protein [Runella salmonicolor]MCP1384829.1 hypothetical protein [Runella salmonicolor]
MNSEFKKALDAGLVEPVMFNGEHFEVDGVKFYQFVDGGTKMTAARFYAMADLQRDHDELKLDGPTLDTAISVIDEALTKCMTMTNDANMQAVLMTAKLHANNVRQRRKYDMSVERTYDNATAFHFADDENPLLFDAGKAMRNKQLWMKNPNALDFFLTQPIGRVVNWQMLYDSEGLNFLRSQLMLELSILEQTLHDTALLGLTTVTSSTLKSRKETLNALITSLTDRLRIILPSLAPTTPNKKNLPSAPKKRRKKKK